MTISTHDIYSMESAKKGQPEKVGAFLAPDISVPFPGGKNRHATRAKSWLDTWTGEAR